MPQPRCAGWIGLAGIGIGSCASALAQYPLWQARFDDIAFADDRITAIVTDAAGNALLAGYSEAGWTAWKLTPNGSIAWYWQTSGLLRRDEEPRIAGLDAGGNLYLVSGSSFGISIVRVAADGQSANVRHHVGRANLSDATVSAAGEVYVAGSLSADPEIPVDVYVARFDRDGEFVWTRTFDGPANDDDGGTAITIGPDGDVYVAGSAGYRSDSTQTLRQGGLVLRYSPAGELVWSSLVELNPETQYESLHASTLAVDSTGSVYVAGWNSSGEPDRGIIFKVAGDGTPQWHAGPLDALYTEDAGRNPRVLLDEARGAVYLASDVRITDANIDFRLRRFGLDGTENWTASYDGPGQARDNLLEAGLDDAGHVHLMGTSDAGSDDSDLVDAQFDP